MSGKVRLPDEITVGGTVATCRTFKMVSFVYAAESAHIGPILLYNEGKMNIPVRIPAFGV